MGKSLVLPQSPLPPQPTFEDGRAFERFGDWLRWIGYDHFLKLYGLNRERPITVSMDLQYHDVSFSSLIRLMFLNETVPIEALPTAFVTNFAPLLCKYSILAKTEDHFKFSGFRLIHHCGVILFVEVQGVAPRFYYGNDSLALGRNLSGVKGRVLDICCGVGTQLFAACNSADSGLGIDIQNDVTNLFYINAHLNHLSDRVDIKIGDFRDGIEVVGSYDWVISNPPLIPTPSDLNHTLIGGGGVDGLSITRCILQRLPELISYSGRSIIVGTVLGDEKGPSFDSHLPNQDDIYTQFSVIGRESLQENARYYNLMIQSLRLYNPEIALEDISTCFSEYLLSQRANTLYSYIAYSRRRIKSDSIGLSIIPYYNRSTEFWSI